ncbi:uncharacterized protein LOC144110168 [Amblyomma americanum]
MCANWLTQTRNDRQHIGLPLVRGHRVKAAGHDRTGARHWLTGGPGRVLHAAPSAASDGRAHRYRRQPHGHDCTRAWRWMTGGAGRVLQVQLRTAELTVVDDRHMAPSRIF